ncbi:2-dehydro-3-deoxygalactonokinase [Sphingomonas sp. CCH5-D11]|uniref:2-dehydro-3-deoxygalactonokinase n=1 Tax=Sphingomonas sp. CCH5-D11 TaxID=1768786 RepID=UPI000829DB8C|nr:2-dehydro-3-deoxygalactonokinase [Sphingomonas sp. CCH5-D11]
MPEAAYLALDWGTTNRRVYALAADGALLHRVQDDRGVLAVPAGGYPAEIAAIRATHGDLPILAAGMIGSTRGWHDVPYVAAPADPAALAVGALEAGQGVTILPGISYRDDRRADVMRGEEVQVFGAIAAGLAPADALFCQPGTHNKWIVAAAGAIADFTTAMTGELFALLKAHGILAGMLDGAVIDGPAFRDGLARGGAGDLPAALFEVRASVLLGTRLAEDAASFASGILIGADVAARPDLSGHDVHLLGSGALADLYSVAIAQAGARPVTIDSETAFLAGIHALREQLS